MIALSVNDISLEYGTEVILSKINFSINEGDRLGVVGVNGAGKSTLLKIICGIINPSCGFSGTGNARKKDRRSGRKNPFGRKQR